MATFENTDVHFSILPHLDALPELGDEWHVEDRRKWLESLDATLAALYPIPGAAQETGVRYCPHCGKSEPHEHQGRPYPSPANGSER